MALNDVVLKLFFLLHLFSFLFFTLYVDIAQTIHSHLIIYRLLTFCYLAAFNWWLILCPSTLSHDWQMGSIPLLTSISDPRNLMTFVAFLAAILLAYRGIVDVEVIIFN